MSNKDKLIASAQKNLEKGQILKAISDYQELLKLEPRNDQFRQKLAELMSRANMPAEAIGHYEVVARGLAERGFYLKAIALYKQIQKLDATKSNVYLQLADLNQKQGLTGNAMAEYRSLLELCEKKKLSVDSAMVLQKMVELEPDNFNLHSRVLQYLFKEKQYDKGIESILFAVVSFLKIGDNDKIQKLFDTILPKLPDDSKVLLDLSTKLMSKNAFNEAGRILNLLIKNTPDDPALLELLADCYKNTGDLVSERLTLGHLVKIEGNAVRCERLVRVCLSEGDAQRTLHELEAHKNILAQAGCKSVLIDLYRELDKLLPGNAKIINALHFLGAATESATVPPPITAPPQPQVIKATTQAPSIVQPVAAVSITPAAEIKPALTPATPPPPAPPVAKVAVAIPSSLELSEETSLDSLLGGFSSAPVEELQADTPLVLAPRSELEVEIDLSTNLEEEELATSLHNESASEDFEIELDLTDLSLAGDGFEQTLSLADDDIVETDLEVVEDLVELEEEPETFDELEELEEIEELEELDEEVFVSDVALSPEPFNPIFAAVAVIDESGDESVDADDLLMDLQALESLSLDLGDEMSQPASFEETKTGETDSFLSGASAVELALDRTSIPVVEPAVIDIDSQYHEYADSEAFELASLPAIEMVAPSRSTTEEISGFSDFDAELANDATIRSSPATFQDSSYEQFEGAGSVPLEASASESVGGFWQRSAPPLEFVDDFPVEETVSDFHAELEEIDFYLKQELFDQAERVCQNILTLVPGHQVASSRLAELVHLRQVKVVAAEIPEDDFFDLASELLDDGALQATEGLSNLEDADRFRFDSVFSEFKKGIESQIDSEDSESHYNLGIAYKEMGLFDDAISEFEKVMRGDPARMVDCLSLVGICNAEKGDFDQAEMVFRTAIARPELSEADIVGMQYELGLIYEVWGKQLEALACFEAVSTIDIFYRNVGEKVDALRASGLSTMPLADAPVPSSTGSGRSRVSFV